MPGSSVYGFNDPGDYQAYLREAGIDLVLTCQGNFKARLTRAELHHVRLLRCQEDLPRIAFVSLERALAFVTFPTHPSPPLICGALELRHGDIMLHGRGEQFHQCTSGMSRWGSIALTPERLAAYGRALTRQDLVSPPASRVLRPPRRAVTRLLRLHAQAGRLAERRSQIVAYPEVARALEQDLIPALIDCLTAGAVQQDTSAGESHASVMIRFEEVLAIRCEGPLRVPELCTAIGVSEQTLRSCCKKFLGISPSHYLRLRRLNLVRMSLRRADPTTANIADVANRYGFSDLGRFTFMYRTRFGETPSTTLRRAFVFAESA
jgi:AraC-like DNA-binding protein